MANIRVKDLPNTNSAADTDEFIIDSSTAGTRRLSYSELKSEISTDFQGDVNTYKIATLASDNKLDPSQIPDTLSQGLNFVGVANSSSDLTSTTQGDFYVIQTAFDSYQVGDQAVYNGSSYTRVTDGTKQIAEGGTGATTLDAAKVNLEIIDVGTAPNQCPTMGMLGSMSVQDADSVAMGTVEAESLEVSDKITTKDVGGVTKGQVEFQDSSYTISGGSNLGDIRQDAPRHRFYSGSTILAQIDEGTSYFQNTSLGIGTASPSADCEIDGGSSGQLKCGNGTQAVRLYADADEATILADGAVDMRFYTNGSEKLRLDTSGRLGVGQSSPGSFQGGANNLVVGDHSASNHGITIASGSSNYGIIYFSDGTTGNELYRGSINYNHSNDRLSLSTSGTTRWYIDSSGNLVANGAHGIDFGSGGASSLLDDYERGTATPTDASGAGLTLAGVGMNYVKIGSQVTAWVKLTYPTTSNANNSAIGGFPFAFGANDIDRVGGSLSFTTLNSALTVLPDNSTSLVRFRKLDGGTYTNAELSGKQVWFSVTYDVS